LLQCSKDFFRNGELSDQVEQQLDRVYGHEEERSEGNGQNPGGANPSSEAPAVQELTHWAEQDLNCPVTVDELTGLDRSTARQKLLAVIDERYRPEMREMERALVLQILDTSWKDHLYAMDHLRSSVGLRGYAQIDPKVEYKREGMRIFEEMWDGIDDKVTGLVFRMEQADIGFVRSLWKITDTVHEQAPGTGDIAQQQQAAIEGSGQGERKPEPIRHRGQRVGRNDPCPCGSGKKYKQCCMGAGR
jgi:preprotein translocase subunit SecA